MKQLPKFISNGNYVIHTQFPAFVATVILKKGDIINFTELLEEYPIASRTNRINGVYYIIAVVKWFDEVNFNNQQDADRLAKLMSRTGDWFYNYIKTLPNDNQRSV